MCALVQGNLFVDNVCPIDNEMACRPGIAKGGCMVHAVACAWVLSSWRCCGTRVELVALAGTGGVFGVVVGFVIVSFGFVIVGFIVAGFIVVGFGFIVVG